MANVSPKGTLNTPPIEPDPDKSDRGKRHSPEYQREKELRRKVFEMRMDKVRLSLWPTNEAVKTLEQKLGEKINYERLGNSVRFMDAWSEFSYKKVPCGNDREALRNLAFETLSARSSRGRRTGKTSASGEEEQKKRQRESSSTSSTSRTPTGKQKNPKQAKVDKATDEKEGVAKSKTAGQPDKSDTTSNYRDNAEVEMNVKEIVEDEAAEPPSRPSRRTSPAPWTLGTPTRPRPSRRRTTPLSSLSTRDRR